MEETIYTLLCAARQNSGSKPALLGLERELSTHNCLVEQIEQTVESLNRTGIGREDRIAIVLRNGPDAAACCLSVAAGATAAPLNPASTPLQFREHFEALRAQAVIVEDGSGSAGVRVAGEMGIPVIRLFSNGHAPAGVFTLDIGNIGNRKQARKTGFAEPDDVALLMLTSGSTARPKVAPLTHRNVCAGASNNASHLQLSSDDRCLCVTGMFYTQGILVSVLSPLLMGGSTVCTPGYDPVSFFAWLDEYRPTWYAAPTAIQRSILARASIYKDVITRSRLRVIRCSSAPAGRELIAQMERLFRAPMLDSYGMTETSSTIVGEPFPPAPRKPGSVGIAVGCEVAAVDEHGELLAADRIGEIVVRGPSVVCVYEGEAGINRKSFLKGWLRTGDLGSIDTDGYVFLTGRIKELINRGGEKISPAEIDEALRAHPAVGEAMAFALPDKRLGEEIAAAVVLRNGWVSSRRLETELKDFTASRLANSRRPRRIVFVEEFPATATGKTIRIGLAEKLGLIAESVEPDSTTPTSGPEPPCGMVQMLLLNIWEDTLGRKPIGIHDDFFNLGGDSLLAARLIRSVEKTFGRKLRPASLFEAPTVARMAAVLVGPPSSGFDFGASNLITVRAAGSLPPLFILGLQPLFLPLIRRLPDDVPVFGLSFPDPASLSLPFRIEEIAARQVEALRRFHPEGPYALAGWCADGVLAYEMARQLRAHGEEVSLVAIIDAFNPAMRCKNRWKARVDRLRFHAHMMNRLDLAGLAGYLRERFATIGRKVRQRVWRAIYRIHLAADRRIGDRLRIADQILTVAAGPYEPQPYYGPVLLLRAAARPPGYHADAAHGWRGVAADLRVIDVPGDHRDMFLASSVGPMAAAIEEALVANTRELVG